MAFLDEIIIECYVDCSGEGGSECGEEEEVRE